MKKQDRKLGPEFVFDEDKWIRHEDAIGRYLWDRMAEYALNPNRKDPGLAFTAGLTRTVARLIQEAVQASRK